MNAYVWADARLVMIANIDALKTSGQLGDVVELHRGGAVMGYLKVSDRCFVTIDQAPLAIQTDAIHK